MSVVLELRPDIEACLRVSAERQGVSLESFLLALAEAEAARQMPEPTDEPLAVRLARLQPEERRAFLAASAAAVEEDYRNDPDLIVSSQFDDPFEADSAIACRLREFQR